MCLRESGERLVRMPVETTAEHRRWPSARNVLWSYGWRARNVLWSYARRTEARLKDPFDERLEGRVALERRPASGFGLPHHCRCVLDAAYACKGIDAERRRELILRHAIAPHLLNRLLDDRKDAMVARILEQAVVHPRVLSLLGVG
jgi:hypothetical protein